jgi:adhesin transport system outer membrane protein
LIADLQSRQSLLPPDGPFATVAASVVKASAGASVAELRVAQLKAQAKSKNWLPQIGPSVNLTSLSGLVTDLLLQQALFDNGQRKAERAYAAADVEVAAVTLASEMNQRVYAGLSYYVHAEQARAQGEVAARASGRLAKFDAIITERMEGGLSDRSEQQVIRQHLVEMEATLAGDRDAEASALAELSALAAGPLDTVRGLDSLPPDNSQIAPLSVLRARGEGAQLVAGANMQRAELMPGIRATASVGISGIEPGVRLGGGLLNTGMREKMAALEATGEVAGKRTAQANEDAQRRIVMLERQITTLQQRATSGAAVLAQTAENLELFTEQYQVGRRTLLELVNQYRDYTRLDRDQTGLRYEMALLRLEIARDRGQLVDGAQL